MKPIKTWVVLVLSCAAYASQPLAAAGADPKADQPPAWQKQMDEARRLAAAGYNYVLAVRPRQADARGTGGVYVFYNNPNPFCYTYMIPGDWVSAREPNAYRSKDGRAFAGVLFWLPENLEGVEGATLVERARNFITREHEKALGQPLVGVEFKPFQSSRPGTWRWRVAPVTQGGRRVEFPAKIVVDLSPAAVAQVTVSGTGDDDGLARKVVDSLQMTTNPECYWSLLERMLKSAYGHRTGP